MSLFGALDTAISGLNAQSAAFGNISDNVANSRTVGFKRVDTAFTDYLTQSTATTNYSGAAIATPDYINTVQGTITQTDNPLGLAISGQGFFAVSKTTSSSGGANNQPIFSPQAYYSRTGDFTLSKSGYLVNSAGAYLNGYSVNQVTGTVDRSKVIPIQVNQSVDPPVATSNLTLSANLPATPAVGTPIASQITIYDANGTQHTVSLNWSQSATDDWTVAINSPDDTSSAGRGTAELKFGAASGNAVASGTIGSIGNVSGSVAASTFAASGPATLSFSTNFGEGAQTVTLNVGTFGGSTGLTQFAGSAYSLNGLTQDGAPPGSYSGVSTTSSGDVVVNYDNGKSHTIARVPVVTFNDPDALQRQDGQAFTATNGSGLPRTQDAGANGAGGIVIGSVEASNVDIASEFSKLIVAQQAYSANTKVVTTASDMLQQTIDMKR